MKISMHCINKIISKTVIFCLANFLFIFTSCEQHNGIGYEKVETISYNNSGLGYLNYWIFNDSSDYIMNFNKTTKELSLINIKEGKRKIISLDKNINFRSFLYHNMDSIFLISKSNSSVYISDTTGKIYDKSFSFDPTFSFGINRYSDHLFLNGYLYSSSLKRIDLKQFFNYSTLCKLFLKDSIIERVNVRFPPQYTASNWWGGLGNSFSICKCSDNQSIIVSFSMANSLFKVNDTIVTEIPIKQSKFFNNFPPAIINDDSAFSSKYIIEYQRKNSFYSNILYDGERHLYYRIAAHSQMLKDKSGYNNLNLDRPWSVILIDSSFTVIDEWYFSPKEYNYQSFQITNSGFAIQKLNDDTSKLVSWDLFKIK